MMYPVHLFTASDEAEQMNSSWTFQSREGRGRSSNLKWNASVTLTWRKNVCPHFYSTPTRLGRRCSEVLPPTQLRCEDTTYCPWRPMAWERLQRGHLSPACLTVSPGLTETATTTPGIGERRMLLVSSVTFSSMNLFSSAASLVKMCTLYLKEKSIKEVKWRAYPLKQHFSRSGFVFKLQS